ncbi:hypothetical protein BZA77DRAFT_387374 [Pyronema omphalodes]|nr:hypothetical protein BZA77DRAFT_387374 [Pyronema omphalodes]
MPTGIESAGLALATFQSVIQGIQAYLQRDDKAKDMWYWRQKIRGMDRELKTEQILFRNTCLRLIQETNFHGVAILMNGDEHTLPEQWKQSDFEHRLSELMGQDIANTFIREATIISGALSELLERLGFDDNEKEYIIANDGKLNSGTSWLRVIKYISKNDDLLTAIKKSNIVIERILPRPAMGP